jgi:flagellar biogenesis protein FliO
LLRGLRRLLRDVRSLLNSGGGLLGERKRIEVGAESLVVGHRFFSLVL